MSNAYEGEEGEKWDLYQTMERLIRQNPWAWQSIGAVLGLVGGVLSPVLGTLLIAVRWFFNLQDERSALNVLSIVSFALTIPLIGAGAHCLDLLERKTAKLSACEENQPDRAAATVSTVDGAEHELRQMD